MDISIGIPNEGGRLYRVLVKRPQEAFANQYLVNKNWKAAGWSACPEYNECAAEHHQLVKMLQAYNVGVRYQPEDWVVSMNFVMIRDSAIILSSGRHIQCSLWDSFRIGEPEETSEFLSQMGSEKAGTIESPGRASGCDFYIVTKDVMIAASTLMTNEEALNQVQQIVEPLGTEMIRIDLTKLECSGGLRPTLTNFLSIVGNDILIFCESVIPEEVVQQLAAKGLKTVPVTRAEADEGLASLIGLRSNTCVVRKSQLGERLKMILSDQHGIEVKEVTIDSLFACGGGLGSLVLPYARHMGGAA